MSLEQINQGSDPELVIRAIETVLERDFENVTPIYRDSHRINDIEAILFYYRNANGAAHVQ